MLEKNENMYSQSNIFILVCRKKKCREILGLTESQVEILITQIKLMVFQIGQLLLDRLKRNIYYLIHISA